MTAARARYEERALGVWDREMGALVLPGTLEWQLYQTRLAATGEHPDPMPPPPAVPIEQRRAEVAAAVNAVRNHQLLNATVHAGKFTFDADPKSIANVTSCIAAVQAGVPLPKWFSWRTSENKRVPADLPLLIQLAQAMQDRVNAIYEYSWHLKDEVIANAKAPETVNILEGWPDAA